MKYGFIFLLMLISTSVFAEAKVLNVYNWSNYMPQAVIDEFEKETGIHINYTVFDSNETMYAKIRSNPHSGYDLVVPSSYFVERMRKAGMLHPLDKSTLSNLKYYNPDLLNKSFDPNNEYSVPYLWGITGIAINGKYVDVNRITRWSDLWRPEYKNQLMLHDDVRQVFSMGLIALGYSINDTNLEHIKQAYLKLEALLPNIKLFNSDTVQNILVDEDVRIGMLFNGDFYQINPENSDLRYVYPEDGMAYWIDNMVIPKYAPHVQNAHLFMNFLMRPDIAKQLSLGQGYSTPNLAAIQMMSKDLRENPILNPPPNLLKHAELLKDVGDATEVYEKYWELLKIGGG